ncbi:MAG: DUF2158 domain-containing protein [Acidobacteriia bacterium]|nr:DUF2158 domain-containing protein [Terriglobia bacterium]
MAGHQGGKKFKRGEIVQLVSGGPKMAVDSFEEYRGYHSKWFVGSKLNEGCFDEASLVKFEEKDPALK